MRFLFFLFSLSFVASLASAQTNVTDTVQTVLNAKELDEVVVKAHYLTRKENYVLAVPTREQRRHALTGYDLLRNLMIPGLSVDRTNGTITTPAGTAAIYIDGREVTFREVQSLRSRDIAKVEYHDMPTGKYAKDAASVNIVLKQLENGGYTQVDGMQGVGFMKGDYNLASKYMIGSKSLNLWAGYAHSNPKTTYHGDEHFSLANQTIERTTEYNHAENRTTDKYLQASISNRSKSTIWMLRAGITWNDGLKAIGKGRISSVIQETDETDSYTLNQSTRNKSIRPSIYLYGSHRFSNKSSLECVLDGYYSRNDYNRSYQGSSSDYISDTKEDYYYTKFSADYMMQFAHHNRLSINLYEYFRSSQSNYFGSSLSKQHLHSSETILFADYSQRLGHFFYDINPGLSFLTYHLHGMERINHITPRMQLASAWRIDKKQQLQFAFALGNTYPIISTINRVEQQIDPIVILRGNPDMDNSILLNPRLSYNLNSGKMSVLTSLSYFYQNHAIMSDFSMRDSNLIQSYRDDGAYHKLGVNLSATYKPSSALNLQLSTAWNQQTIRGTAPHRKQDTWSASAEANYYIGDFAFGATLHTPQKTLLNYQMTHKSDCRYQLSVVWNHDNLGIEMNAHNLFLTKNRVMDELQTPVYAFHKEEYDEQYNQYVTLKVIYGIDYGKKTSKSPKYKSITSESAILNI